MEPTAVVCRLHQQVSTQIACKTNGSTMSGMTASSREHRTKCQTQAMRQSAGCKQQARASSIRPISRTGRSSHTRDTAVAPMPMHRAIKGEIMANLSTRLCAPPCWRRWQCIRHRFEVQRQIHLRFASNRRDSRNRQPTTATDREVDALVGLNLVLTNRS